MDATIERVAIDGAAPDDTIVRHTDYSGAADAKAAYARTFRVHVGVDTGKRFHKLVARGPDGRRRQAIRVEVSRDGFVAADRYLRLRFPRIPRARVLVGVEHAGVYGQTFVQFLRDKGYTTVAVAGFATRKTRELEDLSPRKDDDKDAAQIATLVAAGHFLHLPALDEWEATLRSLVIEHERLVVEKTRLVNRSLSVLDTVWPEFHQRFHDIESPTTIALLEQWPTPRALVAGNARLATAVAQKRSRGHVTGEHVKGLIAAARRSVGVRTGLDARSAEVLRLLSRWKLVVTQILDIEQQLATLAEERSATRALLTVPSVGPLAATTLIAHIGNPASFASPRQVLKLAGMNLARKQRGTSVIGPVRMTKRGRRGLRRQLFLIALNWCRESGLLRDQYVAIVARNGGLKKKAVCAIARKLVPLVLHIAQSGEPFDEAKWRAGRRAASQATGDRRI
jgi:transposase